MSRFEKRLLWFWSGIFALLVGLFFILSFVSRDRIYEANLEYKDSKILESNLQDFPAAHTLKGGMGGKSVARQENSANYTTKNFIEYNAKIKFKNQIFRAQKDLSDIEIIDFKFADSKMNFSADSKEVTNVTSKANALESNNNNGGGGVTQHLDSKNIDNIESNSQNSKIDSKNSINNKADSNNLQNQDSINAKDSSNLSSAHQPILEKDSNKNIESNKFENYQIYNFNHPNNQNFITFIMPQDSIKPTQISYKTHFKITFLLKLLQYYLTGIALFFLTKIKILFKYKKVTILIAFILLTFSFYNNALHIVSPNDFKFWQKDTEASVVGKIIADIHHLDTQGFGLIYPIDYYPTPSQAMQIYEMLENNETPKTIGVYKSAIGLQGFIASYIYRHLNLDSLNLLYFLAAILCAFVITFSSILFAKIINRTFGIVFFATLFLSSGVVNYGNNLYHLYFAWFVPFIFTSLLYLRLQKIAKDSKITESNSQDSNNFDKQDSKHSKKMDFISQNSIDSKKTDSIKLDKTCVLLLALFTLSFTFRAACSYEYITSITLFAISPFLIAFCLTFWESKSKDSKKNTESNLQDSKINSKDSIESKTQDSKNLDSKTQTPTHHPFLEKDSKNSTQTSTLNTDSKILSLSQNPILEKTTLFKMIILLFALAIFGFSLCFIYHCYLRGDGSILQGLENIYKQDYLRRMIGGSASDFDPGYADSLNASVFKVISRYLLGDIYFIFSDVKALAFVLLLISVGILCVCAFKNRNIDSKKSAFSNKDFLDFKNTESTPSLDSKSPLDSKILDSKSTSFNIFSWFKRLFCLDSKDFSNDKNLDSKGFSIFALDLKEVRLCVVLIFVFALSPLSWYIMGKAHSYIHTHMNFILLYFGFIPTLFYVIILNILVGSKTESARF